MSGSELLKTSLKNCSGAEFFTALEEYVEFKIPIQIKNAFQLNSYDSAIALSKFDNDSIGEIEAFMRKRFTLNMVQNIHSIRDYLGIFENDQQHFEFVSGQRRLITSLIDACQTLFRSEQSRQEYKLTPSTPSLTDSSDSNETSLRRHVGALMITVFNDAKRTTLRSWSWPSRNVAAEMAHNFKMHGNSTEHFSRSINLQYLAPINHAEFLDCIVKSDISNVRLTIRESLAVSLRLDGSVDRTQDNNLYVMANILKRDLTTSTLFIGYAVPKGGDASNYLQCLKDITEEILPWEEFFSMITSIVTDGGSVNIGRSNGLCAQLKIARASTIPSQLPLFSIWCVPHRLNLAWKSVTNVNVVATIIRYTTALSSYFRRSGRRTHKLRDVAVRNKLSIPLQYPTYFTVCWTDFVFNLFNVVLRNWRTSIKYFESENLTILKNRWLHYDILHLLTFLTDILSLVKAFQKTCQSDSLSIFDVLEKQGRLFERLDNCKNTNVQGGWEELFLKNVVNNQNGSFLYGIKLIRKSSNRRRRLLFTANNRQLIIQKLIGHLKIRLSLDASLQQTLKPLANITSLTSKQDLKLCHSFIVPDLNENAFYAEYYMSADLLQHSGCETVIESLKMLDEKSPNALHTIKTALARIIAAKPNSADVERLISIYNKFKTIARLSLSPKTLWNYLYINTNMKSLEEFNPTSAVDFWMSKKRRQPKSNDDVRQKEWFSGVFEETRIGREHHTKIEF